MKRVLVIAFVLLSASAFPQRLQMYKTFGGAKFVMDTIQVTNRQVSEILSIDPQAASEFKVARKKAVTSSILGFTGGVLAAIPLGTAIAGGEPEWLLAGGGALLIIASIPFERSFKNHAENAVNGFNLRHPDAGSARRPKLHFNGAGLTFKF
jgi:hypothetical protein